MSDRIAGKVALVTGGASGIGAACARRFAAEGAKVVITDLQEDKGHAVAAEISGHFIAQEVTSEDQWRDVIAQVLALHGRLDILVNNAGIIGGGSVEDCELDNWNRVMAVNVTGTMLGCKHGIGAMKANPGGPSGSIINISSMAGYVGLPGAVAYTASKGSPPPKASDPDASLRQVILWAAATAAAVAVVNVVVDRMTAQQVSQV